MQGIHVRKPAYQKWPVSKRLNRSRALLDDHLAGGKHTAAEVVVKAQAVLPKSALLRAMFDVGYFPPNTPPDKRPFYGCVRSV